MKKKFSSQHTLAGLLGSKSAPTGGIPWEVGHPTPEWSWLLRQRGVGLCA